MIEFPPMLMNVLQAVPLNRAATTLKIFVVDVARQTTAPAPSLPHPGGPMIEPFRVLNGLQAVPLKTVEVKPPIVFLSHTKHFACCEWGTIGLEGNLSSDFGEGAPHGAVIDGCGDAAGIVAGGTDHTPRTVG